MYSLTRCNQLKGNWVESVNACDMNIAAANMWEQIILLSSYEMLLFLDNQYTPCQSFSQMLYQILRYL
jgi:hypothetical protein